MTRRIMTFCRLLALSIAMTPQGACPAEGEGASTKSRTLSFLPDWKLPDTVQIHGFASQTYLHTTGNEFFGHSTNMGSLDFTEMGINGSWRPTSNLQTSMQIVYRRAGRTDDAELRIDFGFLDYGFLSDPDSELGIRLGRVVNPYGLYNDTRDMPFTRPSILLPQSIYFDINRQLALSGDGLQIYGERRTDFGDFTLQFNAFYSRTTDPDFKHIISGGNPGNVDGALSWISRFMYELDAGRVRLGVTSGELNATYRPRSPGLKLDSGDFGFSPVIFSAQYNAEKWTLTSEYALRGTSLHNFVFPGPDGFALPSQDFTGESYYVQGSYRFTEAWEAYARYDVLYLRQSDRSGKRAEAELGEPAYGNFAKDFTAGVRWDINSWLMLRGEYHRINGTYWTSDLENRGDTRQHWDLFAASVNLRF